MTLPNWLLAHSKRNRYTPYHHWGIVRKPIRSAFLRREGDRIVELAKRAQMTKQAVGYLISYLERHGYVERVPDPTDGRAQIVRRTERGWAFQRAAGRVVQEIQ